MFITGVICLAVGVGIGWFVWGRDTLGGYVFGDEDWI